ncbi:MAG TPA: hypothetical protein VM754_06425, partial [Actinomycetota bacterium]|nr:hypothetical protein [Actinomycetota bacterium]
RSQELRGLANRIRSTLESGVQSGQVTERAAGRVLDDVAKAVEEYDDGDIDDALDAVEDAGEQLTRHVDRGEVSSVVASVVRADLDQMAQVIGS